MARTRLKRSSLGHRYHALFRAHACREVSFQFQNPSSRAPFSKLIRQSENSAPSRFGAVLVHSRLHEAVAAAVGSCPLLLR